MPECTFIFKSIYPSRLFILLGLSLLTVHSAYAQMDPGSGVQPLPSGVNGGGNPAGNAGMGAGSGAATNAPMVPSGKKEETNLFDGSSPYLDYGDFNSSDEEDTDTLYFQYGRFFGVSLGLGYQTATGNRGLLYAPAFPRVDIQLHYWFDFQFAMALGVFFATHNFTDQGTTTTVKLLGYGVDLKYYFDVRNASAAISFANPFLVFGAGEMSKTQSTITSTAPDSDSSFTVGIGGGFEFPISYKKTYLILEGKYNTQSFADTAEPKYSDRVPDLSGGFFSLMAHLLFTW